MELLAEYDPDNESEVTIAGIRGASYVCTDRATYGKPEAAMKSMSGVWTGIYTAGVPQELAHALLLAHHRSFVPV